VVRLDKSIRRSASRLAPAPEDLLQECAIDCILRTVSVLGPYEGQRAGDWHADAGHVVPLHVRRYIRVRQPTGPSHEADDHFIDDANDDMIADIAVSHFGSDIVGQDREALLDAGDVFGRVIHQEVDVFREPACAMRHDRKSANQDIQRTGLVQGAADADKVFGLGRSCVRISIVVIHASASSKLEKR
jgi:hypothetical protein